MKKLVLVASCVISLATVACSSDNVIDNGDSRQTNSIDFNSAITRGSRSLDATSDLTTMYVYGTQDNTSAIFDAQAVTKGTENWEYTYNKSGDKPKWTAGSLYKFYAYSYENGSTSSAKYSAGGVLTFDGFTTKAGDGTGDLIYASSDQIIGLQTGNSRVAFTFKHILSQVSLVLLNNTLNAQEIPYNVTISNIKLSGYGTTATFDGTDWGTTTNPANNVSVNNEGKAFPYEDHETASSLFVIPQKDKTVTLTLTAEIKNANNANDVTKYTYSATFTPNWEQGKKYQCTIPVTLNTGEESIEFTVTSLNGWSDTYGGYINLTKTKI